MKYEDYLKSDHWKSLKARKVARNPKRCAICASPQNIDLHHLIYKNLYDVETRDLRWLCRRCHFKAHDLMRSGVLRFPSPSPNSRFTLTKTAVKKELGLTGRNLFRPVKGQ